MKILLTAVVVIGWAWLLLANLFAAGRTAGQMQLREGISEGEAQHRTTLFVLLWALVISGAAIVALVLIW